VYAVPAVVQNSYSLLLRVDERDVIPKCTARGISYEAYSPLAGGFLTGKYGSARPEGSRLALVPQWYEHIDSVTANASVAELAARAHDHGVSAAALAMAWVLHAPGVGRMLAGPKGREHLEHVAAACELRLRQHDVREIGALFA
jgi:1-deoxyxylulose-5-phosphate synthase